MMKNFGIYLYIIGWKMLYYIFNIALIIFIIHKQFNNEH